MKRPPIIIATQAMLLLLVASVLVNVVYVSYKFGSEMKSAAAIILVGVLLVFGLIPLIAFYGINQRKGYGRFVAEAFLVVTWLLWMWRAVQRIQIISGLDHYPDNGYGLAIDILYAVLLPVLTIIMLGLMISRGARTWFSNSLE
jgi:hypothetical protein